MIREPAFSGSFYPSDPNELRSLASRFVQQASLAEPQGILRGLVVPHAGYRYSGAIAGSAYKLLQASANGIGRVLLLGPSHQTFFTGIALSHAVSFRTPLGELPIDPELRQVVSVLPGVLELESAHAQEHSLEVQFPFLQVSIGDVAILPLVVGHCDYELVSSLIFRCFDVFSDLLVIVSSDLSHYLSYRDAQRCDADTEQMIHHTESNIEPAQACGYFPLNGLLDVVRKQEWKIQTLDVRNSGDTSGDRSRVVGYGAFAIWEK